jgi:organic hydroperoxide reductase OsmC/OhrA
MISYPVSFHGLSEASSGIKNEWKVISSGLASTCSVPKEFEGSGGAFSPEDFFLLSLQNCFVATFKVFAEYSRLSFDKLNVTGELIVDKNENLKPIMKACKLIIELTNPSDKKKAELLIKKTLENGFILQSVKTEIITETFYRE